MATLHLGLSVGMACLFLFSVSALSDELGFSFDLIHRDSPNSPFYDPSETRFDRLKNAVIRSHHRLTRADKNEGPALKSKVINNGGEYLMEIALGTPAVTLRGIVDTGSVITWMQCAPCKNCYEQMDPIFDPARSRTYRPVQCSSSLCRNISETRCSGKDCPYEVHYGDGSHTVGTLATETLSLASVAFPGFVFGCGHDNAGTFDAMGSGLVGLGNGGGSLVSQLGPAIGQRFSHCLLPLTSVNLFSSINFGSTALVSGPGTVTAPLIHDSTTSSFYYVSVKGMRVGKTLITADYETIIDSGTTVTILPDTVFDQLVLALDDVVRLETTEDPNGIFSLCYNTTKAEPGINFPAPPISVDFGGGAIVEWSTLNTFVRVSDDVVCFAFISDPSGNLPIIGNLAQMNFLVGYDLRKGTVSFKPTVCANTSR